MRKILIPVDFSDCSRDAFLYAKEIAKLLNFSLKVVNFYGGVPIPGEILPYGLETKEEVDKKLNNLIKTVSAPESDTETLTAVQIETESILAVDVPNQIVKLTKDSDYAMVVMGTRGRHYAIDRLFGSVSSGVAQRAHCPIILVPEGAVYEGFKNVMYASNYESADEAMLNQVIDFANIFRATMHFVHVEEKDNFETVENVIFDKLFKSGDPAFSFNIVNLKDTPVLQGLNQYADENQIELIVLVNRQRRFFENVLQKSLTQKMALNAKRPLMVFHLMNE